MKLSRITLALAAVMTVCSSLSAQNYLQDTGLFTVVPGTHVTNNVALKQLTGGSAVSVFRDGYSSAGDGGSAVYVWSASNCSFNAGAGDNGSQVAPNSGGGCWLASFPATGADVRAWGAAAGANVDAPLKSAIAWACTTHIPIFLPWPSSSYYFLNSEIDFGNGTSAANSTCNGVTFFVTQANVESASGVSFNAAFQYNGSSAKFTASQSGTTLTVSAVTSGTLAVGQTIQDLTLNVPYRTTITALGSGTGGTGTYTVSNSAAVGSETMTSAFIPFVIKGPTLSIGLKNIQIDCNNLCNTGFQFINAIDPTLTDLGVWSQINGPAFIVGSLVSNAWGGGFEFAKIKSWKAINPGTNGSGILFGEVVSGGSNYSAIGNLLEDIDVNWDGTCSSCYGLQLGLANQNTFINTTFQPVGGSSGNSLKIIAPSGLTTFPTDNIFIHPVWGAAANDPGAGWTGTVGQTFLQFSTLSTTFPTSTVAALYGGTDSAGNHYIRGTAKINSGLTVLTSFTATGLVTNADLVNAATTVNGVSCTLGSTCTATADASTLTGSTLAAGVTASSLTSVGTLTGLTVNPGSTNPITFKNLSNYGGVVFNGGTTLATTTGVFAGASGDTTNLYLAGTGGVNWYIAGTNIVTLSANEIFPVTDNSVGLGDSTHRFTNLFLSGTIKETAILAGGSVPTPSGTCAVNTQLGGNTAGSFKANGACAAGTVILTFATTATNGWACNAKDLTTPADALNQTAYSTTTATFTGTMVNLDLVTFSCVAF